MYNLPANAAERLQEVLDKYTAAEQECGCQLVVYFEGEKVVDLVSGYTSAVRDVKVTAQTLFPIFSCGKGFMITAFLRLLAAGKASLDDPVCRWWPEFTGGNKENLQIWQILSHRAGLYLIPGGACSLEEMADWQAMCRRLENAVSRNGGRTMNYHGLTFAWLVGELAQRITGEPFLQTIKREVLDELDIADEVSFGISESDESRCAQLDNSLDSPVQWCENFISNPAVRRGFIPSANAFATAGAVAAHYAALLESGSKQLLDQEWIAAATVSQRDVSDPYIPEKSWANFGLGYVLKGEDPAIPGTRFGHGGAAGAEGYADKSRQLAVGFTKNTPLKDHPDHPIRKEIAAVLGVTAPVW